MLGTQRFKIRKRGRLAKRHPRNFLPSIRRQVENVPGRDTIGRDEEAELESVENKNATQIKIFSVFVLIKFQNIRHIDVPFGNDGADRLGVRRFFVAFGTFIVTEELVIVVPDRVVADACSLQPI